MLQDKSDFIEDKKKKKKDRIKEKIHFKRPREEKDTKGYAEALLSDEEETGEEASYLHRSLPDQSSLHTDTDCPCPVVRHW